jgi:ADP-ribose diphosphatase
MLRGGRRHPGPPLFFPPASRYAGRMGQQIYKGRIVDLRVERVTLPNGTAVDLELMHHPGASAVVAVDDGGRVVLIRQYRHAAGGYIWELPAGILDAPDEPPESCAARELAEEAGVEARELTPLGTIFTTPGFCDERIHLFLARGLRQAEHRHEADEVIAEIARLPLAEALAMVRRGEIVDGKTIAGLHLAAAALAAA